MNRLFIILLVQLITGGTAFCQGVYFKIFPGYNLSVSGQHMPDYLSHQLTLPSGTGFYTYTVNLDVPEFSVASGVNLRAAAGYPINDLLSLELRFSGFANSRKKFEAPPEDGNGGATEWEFRSLSVMPTIMFGRTINKTSLGIYAFSGIGAADLNVTTILNDDRRRFEFDRQPLLSWGCGLEFAYAVSGKFSLFADAGISNTYYRPVRAHLVSSTVISAEYLAVYQKETVYLREITNIEMLPFGRPVPTSPDTRLKETLISNSLAAGIGIKFTPWK